MEIIGKCDVQLATCLLSEMRQVLRSDRGKSDSPIMSVYKNDENSFLILSIVEDVRIEPMRKDPSSGAKDRIDIFFTLGQVKELHNCLKPFIDGLDIKFDDTPRDTPNPTGTEYLGGLPLGRTLPITNMPAISLVDFANIKFASKCRIKLIIDAEAYQNKNRNRFHLGAILRNENNSESKGENRILLLIEYSQLKRLLHSITIALKWFDN
jgi:hypothetical protein